MRGSVTCGLSPHRTFAGAVLLPRAQPSLATRLVGLQAAAAAAAVQGVESTPFHLADVCGEDTSQQAVLPARAAPCMAHVSPCCVVRRDPP